MMDVTRSTLVSATLAPAIIERLEAGIAHGRLRRPDMDGLTQPPWFPLEGEDAPRAQVRLADRDDLPALIALDAVCWPEALRSSQQRLARRLDNDPTGQVVVTVDRALIGVIYSQRIADVDVLRRCVGSEFETLHVPEAPVMQLLAVCVQPDRGGTGVGEALVQLMLRLAAADATVRQVVGVTLCRSFTTSDAADIGTYVAQRDALGLPIDPILRFHLARGARILEVILGTYPGYAAGGEVGVLIEYPAAAIRSDATQPVMLDPEVAVVAVEDAVRAVLGPSRVHAYRRDAVLSAMGMDSLDLHGLRAALNRALGTAIEATFFFRHATAAAIIAALTEAAETDAAEEEPVLVAEAPGAERGAPAVSGQAAPIAIIGMACRFPGGVDSAETFWTLLTEGRDAIADVPSSRWDAAALHDPAVRPGRIVTRQGGFLDGVDWFDPGFFGISPREAAATDPQQRLLLEVGWEALERAGIDPSSLEGTPTGVIVGLFGHDYERLAGDAARPLGLDGHYGTGNAASIAAGRIAYTLGLQGPVLSVDTACSAGLVAVHLATRALQAGDCDLALAGAVNLILSPELSIAFSQAGMLSVDGRCKAFAAGANGYVRSEGCAALVLKRLDDALVDGDPVLAVVEGTAINHDGRSNGLTAPNGLAQAAVIQAALEAAQVAPSAVDYVEAHGTGTALGDPVEVAALGSVYGAGRDPARALVIGSVKANIGHTEAVAGLAGLIKAVLAMRHGAIPRQLHLDAVNPLIDLTSIPASLPLQPCVWPTHGMRRAGVSSFGFSGTNAHVILAEPPRPLPTPAAPEKTHHLLCLQARSPVALRILAERVRAELVSGPDASMGDIAWTMATGRRAQPHRLAVVGHTQGAWAGQLGQWLADDALAEVAAGRAEATPRVAFLFTGQGSQYPGMCAGLYRTHAGFRAAIERCAALFAPHLDRPLARILYPRKQDGNVLEQMTYAQPALFAVEYALAQFWILCGVRPSAVMGHSLGEITAACIAGVLSLEDAAELVAVRGRLMQATPPGAMAVVFADARLVAGGIASTGLTIAGYNSPQNTVVSGAAEDVAEALAAFERDGLAVHRLNVSRAAHSAFMEPMLELFADACSRMRLRPPAIPVISNVTGRCAGEELAQSAYWVRHVRQPVRFAEGIATLAGLGIDAFLEIGPRPVLTGLARDCLRDSAASFLPSVLPAEAEWQTVSRAAGALFVRGAALDWARFDVRPRRRVTLPTTPFERQRHWLAAVPAAVAAVRPLHGTRVPLALDDVVFATRVGGGLWRELNDHRIDGRPVLAAAALAQIIVQAWREVAGVGAVRMESLAWHRPLVLDSATEVQVLLRAQGDGTVARVAVRAVDATSWATHAEARLAECSGVGGGESLDDLRRRLRMPLDVGRHYAGLAELGCDLGAGFRSVAALFGEASEALGCIVASAVPELAQVVLLDGALQVAQAVLAVVDRLHLPLAVEELVLPGRLPDRLWCHAVRTGNDATVLVDLTLFDDSGVGVGWLRGCLFRPAPTRLVLAIDDVHSRNEQVDSCVDDDGGMRDAGGHQGAPLESPCYAWEWVAAETGLPRNLMWTDLGGDLKIAMERRALVLARAGLRAVGWDGTRAGQDPAQLGVVAGQQLLFRHLASALACEVERDDADAGPLLARFPAARHEIALLERCGAALPDVLRGDVNPLELLAPGTDLDALKGLYSASPSFAPAQRAVAEAVRRLLCEYDGHRTLRVLEIGAGTGATTAAVLERLRGLPVEYVFTDVTPLFLARAREAFGSQALIYRLLDIERDTVAQGFDAGGFDLVIAANVLHATVDLLSCLRNAAGLLQPGGALVLLEGLAPRLWIDLIFGLLPGWWRFTDTALRPDYPLLDAARWAAALNEASLTAVRIAPVGGTNAPFPQAVIVTRRVAAGLRFLLLKEGGQAEDVVKEALPAAATLAETLSRLGAVCDVANAGSGVIGCLDGYEAIVDLRFLHAMVPGDPLASVERCGPLFLDLTRLLARHAAPLRLFVAVAGAIAVDGSESARLDAACLHGLSLVLTREHPHIEACVIDIGPDPAALPRQLLDAVSDAAWREPRIALRQDMVLVPRLRRLPPGCPARAGFAGRTQLITGGFGALGTALIDWLISQGATDVAILGRSPPDAAWLKRWRDRGAQVSSWQVDVADRDALAATLMQVAARMLPLGGIFHCAGVHDDGALEGQDWPRVQAALAPKLAGAWHLHTLTQDWVLDHFVLFSSAFSLPGAPGLAGYVAANATLDALGHLRRAAGLPALSVNWGPWRGLGMVQVGNRAPVAEWVRQGLTPMPAEACLAALDQVLGGEAPQVAVMDVDWSRCCAGFAGAPPSWVAELAPAIRTPSKEQPVAGRPVAEASSQRARLAGLPTRRRRVALGDLLAGLVATVLGFPDGTLVDRDLGFFAQGMDSLSTLDLRNRIQNQLGCRVEHTTLFRHGSVNQLTEHLDRLLFETELTS